VSKQREASLILSLNPKGRVHSAVFVGSPHTCTQKRVHGQIITRRPKRRDEPHVPLGAHFTRLPLSAPRSRHHLHDTIIEYSRIRPTPVPNPIVVTRRIPSSVSLESGGVSGKRNVCRDGTRGDISTNHEGACGWGQNMRVWYR